MMSRSGTLRNALLLTMKASNIVTQSLRYWFKFDYKIGKTWNSKRCQAAVASIFVKPSDTDSKPRRLNTHTLDKYMDGKCNKDF